MKNYISYIDTDSLFIKLGFFLENQGVSKEKWVNLSQDVKIKYMIKLSKLIESYVNEKSYSEIQIKDYASQVSEDDFSIKFKQEIICSNILHLGPKMYAFHTINEEGFDCDKIDAKGIEIVRSSSPKVFRQSLKKLLEYLLKGKDDEYLQNMVNDDKMSFYQSPHEDVSVNIGVNGLSKYINDDYSYVSGTPYHIKGVANYHFLLRELGINRKYEMVKEGDKCKTIYIKRNKYDFNVITYYRWPVEFTNHGIIGDYDLMIEKYFDKKAKILLDPINRQSILEDRGVMDDFF